MLLFRFEELGLFFFIPCQAAINLRQTSPSHTMSKCQNLVKPNATVVYQNKKAYKKSDSWQAKTTIYHQAQNSEFEPWSSVGF